MQEWFVDVVRAALGSFLGRLAAELLIRRERREQQHKN